MTAVRNIDGTTTSPKMFFHITFCLLANYSPNKMIDLKYVETPVEQCFIGPRPILGPSYSCFHGAQSLYDLDIKCIDYSPRGLLKEL